MSSSKYISSIIKKVFGDSDLTGMAFSTFLETRYSISKKR